jgi:arsenical pump membrane protein
VPTAIAETLAILALAGTLGAAVVRPRGLNEAVVAVPCALLLMALDVVPWSAARHTLAEIGPTVGFLAATLAFGHLCAEAGVFDYLGAVAARSSAGSAPRLLVMFVGAAAIVTAVLTLDATVVLLTPVVLRTAAAMRVPSRPHLYACARLANSGSLLLPVSNLTNLLAFSASGLSFGRFTALMCLPWLLVVVAEWAVLRSAFRSDLDVPLAAVPPPRRAPRYALGVLVLTVAGFVITTSVHVAPAWAAAAGCLLLIAPRVRDRSIRPVTVLAEASPGFCVFVLALAVIVDGVDRHGLADGLRHLLPGGTGLAALLAVTFLAAALATVVNNLPATLALTPLVAVHPAWLLAMLLGVNIGPNASYTGSLATLLWRRLLPPEHRPRARQFHALGATVPALLVIGCVALWLAAHAIGSH